MKKICFGTAGKAWKGGLKGRTYLYCHYTWVPPPRGFIHKFHNFRGFATKFYNNEHSILRQETWHLKADHSLYNKSLIHALSHDNSPKEGHCEWLALIWSLRAFSYVRPIAWARVYTAHDSHRTAEKRKFLNIYARALHSDFFPALVAIYRLEKEWTRGRERERDVYLSKRI